MSLRQANENSLVLPLISAIGFPLLLYRKNELHQVAQQASNIEDLTEVVRASLSVMSRQWSDAMHTFQEKFSSLSTLIIDHGNLKTVTEFVFVIAFNSFVSIIHN